MTSFPENDEFNAASLLCVSGWLRVARTALDLLVIAKK
jgi:hypothetical protein